MSKLISSKFNRTINFVHPVNERYSCGICLNVADEPINCGNPSGCEGVYCSKCFAAVMVDSEFCPSCNFEIANQPIKISIVNALIADEEVYCIFATDSTPACQWNGQLKDLQVHLDTDCQSSSVPCTNEGCSELVPRHHLPTHLASECEYRSTQCPYCLIDLQVRSYEAHERACTKFILTCGDCGGSYIREDSAAHDAMCPNKLVTCPFACHGCELPVLRKDSERHLAEQGANHAVLIAQRLSLVEGKLSATEARLSGLVNHRLCETKVQPVDHTAVIVTAPISSFEQLLTDAETKLHSSLTKQINDLDVRLSQSSTILRPTHGLSKMPPPSYQDHNLISVVIHSIYHVLNQYINYRL